MGATPIAAPIVSQKAVTIATPDYAKNHNDAVAALREKADELETGDIVKGAPPDPEGAAQARLLADLLDAQPRAEVTRFTDQVIRHPDKHGVVHEFTASFDAVQRILNCPVCGDQVQLPAEYREAP